MVQTALAYFGRIPVTEIAIGLAILLAALVVIVIVLARRQPPSHSN
jgi:hypothetical protein